MIIYKTTNLINGREYIGYDSNNNPNYYGSGKYFNNAVNKYGKINFKKKILCICNNISELKLAEILYIELYDTYNNGYNLTKGGGGVTGLKRTAENKYKISVIHKGRKLTKNHKNNISKSCKGHVKSEEHKENLSKSHKGKIKSEKHKENLSKSILHDKHWRFITIDMYKLLELKCKKYTVKEIAKFFNTSESTITVRLKNPEKYTSDVELINNIKEIIKNYKGKNHHFSINLNVDEILKLKRENYSIKEISKIMNVSTGIIKRRIKNPEKYISECN